MPDLLIYGIVAEDPQLDVSSGAEWTLTYNDQVFYNLPIEFFQIGSTTYCFSTIRNFYAPATAAVPGSLLIAQQASPLSVSFQRIGDVTFMPGEMWASLEYGLENLGELWYLDMTYSYWSSFHGLSAEAATPEADPDGDTLNNFAEFALGGDPYASDLSAVQPQLIMSETSIGLEFKKTSDRVDYQLEYSADLLNWQPVNRLPDFSFSWIRNDENGLPVWQYQLPLRDSYNKLFLRLKLE